MVRGVEKGPDERRRVWEARWQDKEASSFGWHLVEVPAELPRLLDSVSLPEGPALDLGCGEGVTTDYLAERFSLTVGVDIAYGAAIQARSFAGQHHHHPSFVVADAAALPFRDCAYAFVFDRGCLQNMPRVSWAGYFTETDRILRREGMLQLLCSKGAPKSAPSLLSIRGAKVRAKRLLGRGGGGGPQYLSHALLRSLAPASYDVRIMEDFPYVTGGGHHRIFTHAVFLRSYRAS